MQDSDSRARSQRFLRRRLGVPLVIAMVALGPAAGVAIATTIYSNTEETPKIAGHWYDYWSSLTNSGGNAWGIVGAETANGGTVGVGFIGANSYVVDDDNQKLCAYNQNAQYNSSSTTNFFVTSPTGAARNCGAANYYAYGYSYFYNGNGYNAYTDDRTADMYLS